MRALSPEPEPPKAGKRKRSEEETKDASACATKRKKKYSSVNVPRPLCEAQRVRTFIWGGLRHVAPYDFTYETFSKRRWLGKPLLEVLTNEFALFDREYFAKALASGRITMNGTAVSADYLVKDNDKLLHTVHMHELPVTGEPVRVLGERDGIVAVYKPANLPVHPRGRYRYNSLLSILDREHSLQLRSCHRLDRLTSGLLLFAKDRETANKLQTALQKRECQKRYIARVLGDFPDKEVTVDQPIGVLHENRSRGVRCVLPSGKSSSTHFRRLHGNGHTTVVECWPHTGRTHQIRVHLQWLGFPIANDPCYGGALFRSNAVLRGCRCNVEEEEKNEEKLEGPSSSVPCSWCESGCYWKDGKFYCHEIWLHAAQFDSAVGTFKAPLPAWGAREFDSRLACKTRIAQSKAVGS